LAKYWAVHSCAPQVTFVPGGGGSVTVPVAWG